MKIYDLIDADGRIFAFEVDYFHLGRRKACRLVRTIPGVSIEKEPKRWRFLSEDEFCEFRLGPVLFVVWEPFGDNSRYWVGPKPPRWVPETAQVRAVFERARPLFGFVGRARTGSSPAS
jgi:hypothetical protein